MIIKKKQAKINSLNSNEKNKKIDETKTISLTKDEDNNKKQVLKKIEQI